MGTFPFTLDVFAQQTTISVHSVHSLGGCDFANGSTSSAVWPAANLAMYIPFRISQPMIVTQLFTYNGATASGNTDIGIYDEGGVKIISTGSTAQAGTNTLQAFNITDTRIDAGLYYWGIAKDDITGTFFRTTFTSALMGNIFGLAEQTSAFALPATATFANYTRGVIPHIGMTTRSVL